METIGIRTLTWQERRDLLTKEQREGDVTEDGYHNGFGYISPFTGKMIHNWLDHRNIPTKCITVTNGDKVTETFE